MIWTGEHLAKAAKLAGGGKTWRPWLARKLDCSERMIRYYESGSVAIPPEIIAALTEMVAMQRREIDAFVSQFLET